MILSENDYQILKLTDAFYKAYPNPPYREILKKKQMLFTEEKFLKISTKDFQVFMVAMLKRVAKPVCSVFV